MGCTLARSAITRVCKPSLACSRTHACYALLQQSPTSPCLQTEHESDAELIECNFTYMLSEQASLPRCATSRHLRQHTNVADASLHPTAAPATQLFAQALSMHDILCNGHLLPPFHDTARSLQVHACARCERLRWLRFQQRGPDVATTCTSAAEAQAHGVRAPAWPCKRRRRLRAWRCRHCLMCWHTTRSGCTEICAAATSNNTPEHSTGRPAPAQCFGCARAAHKILAPAPVAARGAATLQ